MKAKKVVVVSLVVLSVGVIVAASLQPSEVSKQRKRVGRKATKTMDALKDRVEEFKER